jgi:hypothetical protein
MNRKAIFNLLTNGDGLSAADVAALKLPAVASAAADYVTAKYVPGPVQRVILTLTALPVTVANTTGISFGSKQLLDFAQGRIRIEGGTCDLVITFGPTIATAGSGDFSIGTTATADGTLNSTEVDLMASTAMLDPFVLQVGTGKGLFVKDTEFDGTATAKDAFLNVIVDDADVSDAGTETVLISGTIILDVAFSGDY